MKNRQEITQDAQELFKDIDLYSQFSEEEIKNLRRRILDLISNAIEVYKNLPSGLDSWELHYLDSAINDLHINMSGLDSIIWLRRCLLSIELSTTEKSERAELFPDSQTSDAQTLEEAIRAIEAQLATQ